MSAANCAFGGPALDDLYVTTLDGRLYRVRGVGRRGLAQPPVPSPMGG